MKGHRELKAIPRSVCLECNQPWPCDAVELASLLPAALEALEEAQRCDDCADSPENIRLPAGYRCYFCDKRFCGLHAEKHFAKDGSTAAALAKAQGKLDAVERFADDHCKDGICLVCPDDGHSEPHSPTFGCWVRALDRILSKEGNGD